jgi:hypothetical protein
VAVEPAWRRRPTAPGPLSVLQVANWEGWSGDVFDDLDEFVDAVAVVAGEVDEFSGSLDDCATFGCAGDGDAAAASEFEQAFVSELPECPEDGVGVDLEDCGEVFGRWEALAGPCFSVGDRASDLGGDLFVEVGGVVFVDLDILQHDASNSSAIVLVRER